MSKANPAGAQLAESIGKLALDKKAENILIIDLRGTVAITDFFVVCSAATDVQVKAIADAVRKGTENKPWHIEGYDQLMWVLLDYVDVVVHIFRDSARGFYQLERLWADAPSRTIKDESEEIFSPPTD